MVTHDDIVAELQAIEHALTHRVELWRVVVDEHGNELQRIYRGSFTMPPDWQPPTLEQLMASAKNTGDSQ